VTLEEINSQIALEYGQAMTVKVLKADGETMRKFQYKTTYVVSCHDFRHHIALQTA
jgi:hypothetical protein